jgi:hypothetical protein
LLSTNGATSEVAISKDQSHIYDDFGNSSTCSTQKLANNKERTDAIVHGVAKMICIWHGNTANIKADHHLGMQFQHDVVSHDKICI